MVPSILEANVEFQIFLREPFSKNGKHGELGDDCAWKAIQDSGKLAPLRHDMRESDIMIQCFVDGSCTDFFYFKYE